jgi:hypothetical protein
VSPKRAAIFRRVIAEQFRPAYTIEQFRFKALKAGKVTFTGKAKAGDKTFEDSKEIRIVSAPPPHVDANFTVNGFH